MRHDEWLLVLMWDEVLASFCTKGLDLNRQNSAENDTDCSERDSAMIDPKAVREESE